MYIHIYLFKKSWVHTAPIPKRTGFFLVFLNLCLYVPSLQWEPWFPRSSTHLLNTIIHLKEFQNYFFHTTIINTPTKKSSRFICNILHHPTNAFWLRMYMVRVYSLCLLGLVVYYLVFPSVFFLLSFSVVMVFIWNIIRFSLFHFKGITFKIIFIDIIHIPMISSTV